MPTSILAAARDYAKLGWSVLPIRPNAKTPTTAHGVLDASRDEAVISKWWEQTPTANIAIATGTPSGVWVLDLDGADGIAAFEQLESEFAAVPPTPRAKTGNGEHLFFEMPVDDDLKNSARINGLPIDVRATGGYVVAPPSRHPNGQFYEWVTSPEEVSPAAAPEWLLDHVRRRRKPAQTNEATATVTLRVKPDTDLNTAAGVEEGRRHDELCRLVGAHLRRGDSATSIEALALTWSQRCKPALPADEVLKTVHSLAEKHGASSHTPAANPAMPASANELESIPLPEPPEWPQLDSAAYHGLAGDVVTAIEPFSEADPVALLIQLLALAANSLGRAPRFLVEGDFHHAALFVCLVGQTARGRKGTAKGRVGQVVRECDPQWYEDRIVSGLSSGEGLIHAVRDPVVEQEEVKDKGVVVAVHDVVKDPGGGDRRLMVVEPEFGRVLRVMRRDGNPLSPVIRQFWDSGNARTLTKNNPLKATGAHVGIVAHITRPELERHLDATSLFDGFANRFLWAVVRRSKLLPDGGGEIAIQQWIDRVRDAVAVAKQIEEMRRSPAARDLWHAAYPELTAERPSVIHDAVTSRAEAQVLRLSMIYTLLDGTSSIEVAHLKAALALWDYCDQSAKLIFAHAETEDPLAQKIREALEQAPNGLTRTEIHDVTGRNHPAKLLVEKLAKLRDRGLIECRKPESGKPGPNPERWFLAKRPQKPKRQPSNSSYNSYSSSQKTTGEISAAEAAPAAPAKETAPTADAAVATLDSASSTVDESEIEELMERLARSEEEED